MSALMTTWNDSIRDSSIHTENIEIASVKAYAATIKEVILSDMINRDDMLELTRRMNISRSCFSKVAGAYISDGEIEGGFNTSFLKLPPSEKTKTLSMAKTIPFSKTNEQLKDYNIPQSEIRRLLLALLNCGLKNDALLDTFYEVVTSALHLAGEKAIFVFYGSYDIPLRSRDGADLFDSEEVYNFIICTISCQIGEYEPDTPYLGFLYPAFENHSSEPRKINVFSEKKGMDKELLNLLLTSG